MIKAIVEALQNMLLLVTFQPLPSNKDEHKTKDRGSEIQKQIEE